MPRVASCSTALLGSLATCVALAQAVPVPKPTGAANVRAAGVSAALESVSIGKGFLIEPVPAWVVPAVERPDVPVEASPMHYRVIDDQIAVEANTTSSYTRLVRVADDASGLATASQLEIEFDPSYQVLVMHRLDVVRAGKVTNRLQRERIRMLHRETQLERRVYDGRITASIVLDDVRPGDQIDMAYTLRGANPVFAGKFASIEWAVSQRGPTALYQLRLLAPVGRDIRQKVIATDIRTETRELGRLRETIFRRESVPQLRLEPGSPPSVLAEHQIQLSEFADWAEVARWGQTLFDVAARGPAVQAKAAELRGTGTPSEQVLAALDFVQQDVRYFGTEIGLETHRPAPPDKVLQQRFGDCKDKVVLFGALLRQLGVQASPVLVSSQLRAGVTEQLPSPLAFDHVIARVDLEGSRYWLDATRGQQTGPLAGRQTSTFGSGLALEAGTRSLVPLPSPYDLERSSVVDTIRIERFRDDPRLESRITYRGDLAEAMRESVATRGRQEIVNDLSAAYLKLYPRLRTVEPMVIEESRFDNAVTFVQHFAIADFWRFPEQKMLQADLLQWSLVQGLLYPKSERRRNALAYQFPGRFRQVTTIEFPEDVYGRSGSQSFEDGDSHVSVRVGVESGPRRIEYTAETRFLRDRVEARDWQAYTALVNRLVPKLGISPTISAVPPARLDALDRELKTLEDALRSQKIKVATPTQAQARFRALALTAQLDGGRLPATLEAQALAQRGIQYDHSGRADLAAVDFARALEMAPESDEVGNGAATNALVRGDVGQAIALADRVLSRSPRDSDALGTRALARYLRKDLPAARSDLGELLKDRASVRRGLPVVWMALTLRQSGVDPTTFESGVARDQLPDDWPRPVVDMAFGRAGVDAVVAAAKASKRPNEALCEAYFYIAEKYFSEGDSTRAAEYWRKSADLGVVEFLEDSAARFRLAALAPR